MQPAAGRPPTWTEISIACTQVDARRNAPQARFQSPAQKDTSHISRAIGAQELNQRLLTPLHRKF
jgi:hypothetical protein